MADFSYTGMMEFDGLKVSDEAACHVYKVGHSCHQVGLQAFNTFIHYCILSGLFAVILLRGCFKFTHYTTSRLHTRSQLRPEARLQI
jgi:hypothetical protein